MWLLHTSKFLLKEFNEGAAPKYSILSHTWEGKELEFKHVLSGTFNIHPRFRKIEETCKAVRDKYEWIWIDSCNIDKSSSSELSHAINSMYRWYEDSDVCYVYLENFEWNGKEVKIENLKHCRWFTRGWTLQELLAPKKVVFWDCNWNIFGTKSSLSACLSETTGIPKDVLDGTRSPRDCIIAQRMSWASNRETSRSEDIAYCLLGLFDVHLSPKYGEGAYEAFIRLQKQILKKWYDSSIFLWSHIHDNRNVGLLASSPKPFCKHIECFKWLGSSLESILSPNFDPYEFFIPLNGSPATMKSHPTGEVRMYNVLLQFQGIKNLPPPVLGPQGLQISLLADKALEKADPISVREKLKLQPIICLDLAFLGKQFTPSVLVRLYYDLVFSFNYSDLQRRGLLSRTPNTLIEGLNDMQPAYQLTSECQEFSRQTIYVSQPEPIPGANQKVKFIFEEMPLTATMTGITLDGYNFDSEDDLMQKATTSGIYCFGGRAAFLQKSVDGENRNIPFLINFGVRGSKPEPWCCISNGMAVDIDLGELNQPNLKLYKYLEIHNNRYRRESHIRMHGEHVLSVVMNMNFESSDYEHPVCQIRIMLNSFEKYGNVTNQSQRMKETVQRLSEISREWAESSHI